MKRLPLFFESDIVKNDLKFNAVDLNYNKSVYQDATSKSFLPNIIQNNYLEIDETYNSKYFYPIYTSCLMFFHDNLFSKNLYPFNIPKKVLEDVKNNNAKILLVNTFEGYSLDNYDKFILEYFIKPYHLTYNNFITLTGNLIKISKKGVKNIYLNSWEDIIEYHQRQKHKTLKKSLENIFSNNLRPYKFICLQRRPKIQRLALFTELFDQESGILTMGIGDQNNFNYIDSIEITLSLEYPKIYKKYQKRKIKTILPKQYDVELSFENPTHDDNVKKYFNSYLHIVSETYFENTSTQMFFSEKIYKPIVFLQPFILFGQTNSLKYLKELGFKTFSSFIDESYDDIKDDHQRFYAALNSVKEFLKQDITEIHKKMKDMLPILKHNYFNLKNREKYYSKRVITELLLSLCKKSRGF